MLIGPVFTRELVTQPRRTQHHILRTVYPLALWVLVLTAWMVLAGTQRIRNISDMARFGTILFQILATLNLAILTFLSAVTAASAVAQEKDKKTLVLLLMTQLSNHEVVLGKLFAALLEVFVMFVAAAPLFLLLPLFGGVDYRQVGTALAITAATIYLAGSLGSLIALAQEKTYQTLSTTALALVGWLALAEGAYFVLPRIGASAHVTDLVAACSPWQALWGGALTAFSPPQNVGGLPLPWAYTVFALVLAVVLNGIAVLRLRAWNPGRETFAPTPPETADAVADSAVQDNMQPHGEAARSHHIDARVRKVSTSSRQVWDNPILWRETQTRAYGRKMILVRLAYWSLFVLTMLALHDLIIPGKITAAGQNSVIPPTAQVLVPFFVLSLVIVNSLAVTSITNERDGGALELIMVTDLSPREFTLGKIGGVLWVTREMVLLPIVAAMYMWLNGALYLESFLCLAAGMLVMNVFGVMLGIHYGCHYANSRSAIGVSLATVFFLFLGIVTLIVLMISFSGSFQLQLAPFLAFIVGGCVSMYVALGSRKPSAAILAASIFLPPATFVAITSFLLGHVLSVFLLIAGFYGFTTLALLIPALAEFDFAMGRSKAVEE